MARHSAYLWLVQSEARKSLLLELHQPMTASQLARRTGQTLDGCLYRIWSLRLKGVLQCLNPETIQNRLYWLTRLGEAFQTSLRMSLGWKPAPYKLPDVPWDLYSSVCFSHRSAVIKALREPMQAARIKRVALLQNPSLRMSANNVRDVMKYLHQKGIVRKFKPKTRAHPRYELTETGKVFQLLLFGTTAPVPR